MPRPTVVVDPAFPLRLRQLRETAGLSLRDLARVALSSKSHLHDFECGRKLPSFETVERIDQALSADGELMRMVVSVPGWADPAMRRRSFVGMAAGLAVGLPQAAYDIPGRRRTEPAVAQAVLRTARLRRLDDYLGGTDTYAIYLAEVESTAALLRAGNHSESTGRGLLAALAEQAQMAGFSAFDAGWQSEAERLFRLSLTAAQDAGDVALAANALTFLGYQQLAIEGRGADLSVAACEAAIHATPRVRALQLERRAWAHAVEGQSHAAEASLAAAEAALHGYDDRAEPDWAHWVDEIEIRIMAGRCWTVLGRPLRAISVLEQALRAYEDTHSRDKALYLTFLAQAYLDANEVEQGCDVIEHAMDLASGVGSVRPRQRVAELIRRLGAGSAVPRVAEVSAYAAEWATRGPSLPAPTPRTEPGQPRSAPR